MGTLTYSYLLKGELNAVLGIEGLKTYPKVHDDNWLSNPELKNTLLCSVFFKKISSTLGMGQVNFLVTLFNAQLSMTNHFPPSPFGTTIIGADQLDLLLWITFAVSNFSFLLLPIGSSSWK